MPTLDHIIARLRLSPTKEKIVRNLFWSVIGKIVTLAGGLFVGIIIARHLGPAQYGMMNYVISFVSLFQIFASLGLDNIEIREEARASEPYNKIIGTAFGLKLLSALLTIAVTILISYLTEKDTYITAMVALYSCSMVANTLTVTRNYFTSQVKNEYVVKTEIVGTVIGMGIKILLLFLDMPLTWFIAATTFDYFILASGYWLSYKLKSGCTDLWTFDRKYALYLLAESLPLMLTSTAVLIYQRIDQVMIGNMIDKESVGYFSVASRFVEVLIYIPTMLAQTISPVLVSTRKKSQEEYMHKCQLFMNISFWFTMTISLTTSVLSYWIISLTFGQSYIYAAAVLQVLVFKAAFVALSSTAGNMIIIEGLQKWVIMRDILGCIVCVVMNYLLLPRYGIMAAAIVAIASNIMAGYVADAIIPQFRHIFVRQTKALLFGWCDMIRIKSIIRN